MIPEHLGTTMYTTAFAAALAALAPLAGPLPQEPPQDQSATIAAVSAYLDARFDDAGVPGAAYAILSADGDTNTAFWGEDGNSDPVDEDTPFLWGSVAKPVTATAAMVLVEEGRLDLDEPIVAYLPDFTLADASHSDRITMRHLLQQTSGIPEGTGITDRFEHREDPYGEAVSDLADVEPFAEPGATFEYASANYLVVGAVIEAVAGVPYDQFLRESVLDPIGMDSAVTTADAAAAVPGGYAPVFGQAVPVGTQFDQTGPSYGYLGGDIGDLSAFAATQLGPESTTTLAPESLALMHAGATNVNATIDYGLGWRVDSRNEDLGTTTVWHTGAAPGFAAGVLLLPELDRALVVMQNRYGHFEEGPLIGAMLGATRILAGGEGPEFGVDPLYSGLLTGLSLLIVAALVFLVWTFVRIAHGPKPSRRKAWVLTGSGCWVASALAIAYVSWVAVPGLAPSRTAFFLLAPDVAWLLVGLGVAALLLAAARVWHGAVRLRRPFAAR
ncbi:MAG TPA: serine hydrolase domain-containing protein [Glycomyces sp.]|nr:serine hydrolase domain-containing protein [Glycomyces sp.]